MAESTTISASQQRVIDYLEKLASEGKTVPTTRAIREAVRVSPNEITIALKIWKARQAEAQTRAITEITAQVIDDDVSKALNEAMSHIKTVIANAVTAATQKYDEADKNRATQYAQKEAELLERAERAEQYQSDALMKVGRFAGLLDAETESRKRAEKEIEKLRVERDRLETQLEEAQLKIAALQKLCEEQKTALLKVEDKTLFSLPA